MWPPLPRNVLSSTVTSGRIHDASLTNPSWADVTLIMRVLSSSQLILLNQVVSDMMIWFTKNISDWGNMGMDQYLLIPFLSIFRGMNIHLPAILMWTTGVQGFDTLPFIEWRHAGAGDNSKRSWIRSLVAGAFWNLWMFISPTQTPMKC